MEKIWNWLNGNKTLFGMAILFIAQYVPADMLIWVVPLGAFLNWVGGLLTGVGVVHKMIKADTTPAPNK